MGMGEAPFFAFFSFLSAFLAANAMEGPACGELVLAWGVQELDEDCTYAVAENIVVEPASWCDEEARKAGSGESCCCSCSLSHS